MYDKKRGRCDKGGVMSKIHFLPISSLIDTNRTITITHFNETIRTYGGKILAIIL